MQSKVVLTSHLLAMLLYSYFYFKIVIGQIRETSELTRYKDLTSVLIVENPIYWTQDCGFLELSGCESVTNCNLNVGSNYSLLFEWMPVQPYDRLNYFISAVKLFPYEHFMFVQGSDGPYENDSVFVHQELFHINETFRGTGNGWSILFVKEINGIMDVCYFFEVNVVNPFLNYKRTVLNTVTVTTQDSRNSTSTLHETETIHSGFTTLTTSTEPVPEITPTNKSLNYSDVPDSLFSSTTSSTDWSLVCTVEGLFPHLNSCSSFHYCLLNNFTGQFYDVILQCPTDLVFCDKSKICDTNESCPCPTPPYR